MTRLAEEIKKLSHDEKLREKIIKRLSDFKSFQNKPKEEWFSELCFCLLTANSKARTAIKIQDELGAKGFCNLDENGIRQCIIDNKHRFHNNKTKFILDARKHLDIKTRIQNLVDEYSTYWAREWLVENIKGMGYKEASHFLRNVGYTDLAILDRHIINLMIENNLLKEKPKTLNKKSYPEIEKKLDVLANELKMNHAELDLYMWFMKGGDVLK
ncbi:MAG: N-glycosylase/DNA lyase [Candidatus Woesearchaeota archaeon]